MGCFIGYESLTTMGVAAKALRLSTHQPLIKVYVIYYIYP